MIDFNILNKGDVLSEHQFYVVTGINGNNVSVVTSRGNLLTLSKDYVNEAGILSANAEMSVSQATRTSAIQIIMANPFKAMTIKFRKKPDTKVIAKQVIQSYYALEKTEAELEGYLNEAIKGEERTISGMHHGTTNEHGRLLFTEITLDENNNFHHEIRQVDPRTVESVILDGVKYVVK